MRPWLAGLAAMALGTAALADPEASPGPDLPPAGTSFLSQLFPDGLPFPFEAVLDRLRALAGPENVTTALIPLGRSLQRYAAAPDYFSSPRLVVAVTGDHAAGPGAPRLADRLFLGYQPAAAVIEAISYDPAAARFEFQEIVGYTAGAAAVPEPAERRVCLACHQGQGPIFPRPLWSETNANPAVAARLTPLGESFHGAPTRQTVDALEALDAATDRAARLPLASRLWAQACPDPACRAALLAAALRTALGATAPAAPPGFGLPGGVASASPDLPNRDPFLAADEADLETTDPLNPETPRAQLTLWSPGPDAFPAAAREIAAQLSPGDVAWIESLLRRHAGPSETLALPCTTTLAALPAGVAESRFTCATPDASLTGFHAPDGTGRLETLALPGQPPLGAVALPVTARAPDGRRIGLALTGTAATVTLTDDLTALDAGLARHAGPTLAHGPFPREAVLTLLATLLGGTDG